MENANKTILEKLKEYALRGVIPMHMPGHKRNCEMAEYLKDLGAAYDITEICCFDDLHDANGILAEAMNKASALWNSQNAYFLTNGSTCGILAGIRAATRYGDKILVARNAHKSIYNALELCALEPVFILPPLDSSFGIYSSICPADIEKALDRHPDVRLVVLTSPTYEGVISDVQEICKIAHSRKIPVLVDEAHGAHLGFSDCFNGGAVKAGADIVVQSLHKTLPSLTQTAILHVNGDLINRHEISRQLTIFETSSPSYLLLASIDGCTSLLETEGKNLFCQWENNLKKFDEIIKSLSNLRIFAHGADSVKNHTGVYAFDPGKIVISTRGISLTGSELMELFSEKYNIELEMASGDFVLAMTGLGDTEKSLTALASALLEIDKSCSSAWPQINSRSIPVKIPDKICGVIEAMQEKHVLISLEVSVGKTAAEYIWAYPPGIPLIIPGEKINAELITSIRNYEKDGIHLRSTLGDVPKTIAVLQEI